MTRPKKSTSMSKKQPKLKVIIHVFGLSRDPSSERHGIFPWDTGGHLKWGIWLGTNIWMPLRSFRGNFGFHEKWTNRGVQSLFEERQMVQNTRATLQVTSALLGMFREKIWLGPKKSKDVQKTAKIEGYNTRFWTFPGPSSGRHKILPWDTGGHWKWVIWLGTNIWMPLRSFEGNFRFHEKWTNGGIQRLFEARQMVPSTQCNVTSHVGIPRNVSGENMTRPREVQICPKNS